MNEGPADFAQRVREARRIVVIDLGFLGDSVHLLPALWEIRRHHPAAALHTVSAPVGREVLALAPCVTRAWSFPLGPQSPPWWRHGALLAALRRERFDLAFNFSGADRTLFFTALTGARWRLAHAGGRRHFYNRWLIRDWVSRRDRRLPVFEQRRQVLAAAGYDLAPARFDLRPPADALAWAEQTVPAGALHVSINASTHLKEWPLAHSIRLIQLLLAADPHRVVVATGSEQPREQQRLESLRAAVPDPRLHIPRAPRLPQLVALLGRCRLHFGPDSGVLQLAMALGLPTVAVFRDYAGLDEWRPHGPGHHQFRAPCPCANQRAPACAQLPHAACLAGIEPETVARWILGEPPGTGNGD